MSLRRDVIILACASSAGIHAALAPAHFDEGLGAGLGFLLAAVVLGAIAVGMTLRPAADVFLAAAGIVLTGLLVSYGLAITTGVPVLHPDPEPVDGLALATKAIEAAGLLAALFTRTERNPTWIALVHPVPSRWR